MKEFISVLLSLSLVYSTSCTQQTSNKHRPAPSKAESPENVEQANTEMAETAEQSSFEGESGSKYQLNKTILDKTVTSLMASQDLYIKNYAGVDGSIEEFRTNPSQYFILFKEKNSGDKYRALKTSAPDLSELALSKLAFQVEVFDLEGDIKDFVGNKLDEPSIVDTLALDVSPIGSLTMKTDIKDFLDRIKAKDAQLASNTGGTLDQISNFLFPTAYANNEDYRNGLLWTAIGFSIGAGVSILFARRILAVATIPTMIVFWMLYFITPEEP